jgi:hypothetical protein
MTMSMEATKNGVVVSTTSDANHASGTDRGSVMVAFPDVVVGDVLNVFVWLTGGSNNLSVIDWWGRGCAPSRLFRKSPPAGGRYAYRNLTVLGTSPAQAPATVLSHLPGWGNQSGSPGTNRWFSTGVDQGTATPSASLLSVSHPTTGIAQNYGVEWNVTPIADLANTTIWTGGAPTQVRFDQLAIPW